VWAPHRFTASFRHPSAPVWGPFHGLWVDMCSAVDLHGLQGDSLPHHGLHHRLQGKISALACRAPPPPPSFTDLGVCRVVSLTQSHSSLSTAVSLEVFPLLKCVITEALPPSLFGLSLASGGSVLELSDIGSVKHGGKLLAASHRSHPCSPLATKTLSCKPRTLFQLLPL